MLNQIDSTTRLGSKATVLAILTALLVALFATLTPAPTASAAKRADRAFIVTAGDSLVSGSGARKRESWPAIFEDVSSRSSRVENVAVGGSCLVAPVCGDVLSDHFDQSVLALDPDLVIVGSGRNDLCHISTRDLIAGYKGLQGRAAAAGVLIRFTTITPVNSDWQWPCEAQRVEINEWLRTQPGTLDLESRVSTPSGQLRKKYAYSDGLHMNATGYAAAGRYVSRAMRPELARIMAEKAAARR